MIEVVYRTLTKSGFEGRKFEIKDDELDTFLKAVDAIEPHDEVGNELKENGDDFIVHLTQPISAIVLGKRVSPPMPQLLREREGLQLAKFFMGFCYSASDMITFNPPEEIIRKLKEYAQTICDDCGGAMCDTCCPVSKYIDDMDKWLKGEKTVFTKDFSESHDVEKQGENDVK